jgi:hypothetical protein
MESYFGRNIIILQFVTSFPFLYPVYYSCGWNKMMYSLSINAEVKEWVEPYRHSHTFTDCLLLW